MDDAWQLATAPEVGERLAAYAAREEARLTPAALEALAVVAYRQPCTRGEVERVRGVDSDYVLRSLLHRRLVAEMGRRDTPGRPILYGTTFTFLERFGLTSLDDLPPSRARPPPEGADRAETAPLRRSRSRSMPAERIQKLLARAASRRAAAPRCSSAPDASRSTAGRPARPAADPEADSRSTASRSAASATVHYAVHKPIGLVSSAHDERGRARSSA